MLYGYPLKLRRWKRSFMQGYLADMERLAPPDAEACRALARETLARLDFEIALAEAGYAARALSLPRALALSLQSRHPAVLGTNLKYLFDGPYLRWRRLRRGDDGLTPGGQSFPSGKCPEGHRRCGLET